MCFRTSAPGTYGNLGRNTLIGPRFFNADLALVKNTAVREKMNLEFRAEFFNLLNHSNFMEPNILVFSSSRLRSGNAGRITGTATDNREIQLGMKLTF